MLFLVKSATGTETPAALRPGAVALAPFSESIRFRDLVFAYEGDRPVLNGLTLVIPKGHTLAIVGPSGARLAGHGAGPEACLPPVSHIRR